MRASQEGEKMSDHPQLDRRNSVLWVTFNRPARLNAMTWDVYDGLVAARETADADPAIKVLVLRARLLTAEEAHIAGFLSEVCEIQGLDV